MHWMTLLGLAGSAVLAFANGANDISKSIATLVGSGESDYKKAVVLASLAVAAGGVMASAWAVKLTLLFTRGMLSPQVQIHQLFALSVLAGAIGWVLLATRLGLPVSTTHAIVGSVILTAIYAFGFSSVLWAGVTKKVLLPLLLSPVAAYGMTWAIFKSLFWLCRQKYCLNCHWVHWMSAISTGFTRGLNDTPKIAALGLAFYYIADPRTAVEPRWFFFLLAAAMAAGGIFMGLKVTETLAHRVTVMNHLEGFAANLATALLVGIGAFQGWPMSTTHVASSGIMGMGLQKGGHALNRRVAGEILAAWVITLPGAGMLSAGAYWLLQKMV